MVPILRKVLIFWSNLVEGHQNGWGRNSVYEERLRWAVVQPGEQVTSGRPSSSLPLHVKWSLHVRCVVGTQKVIGIS